MTMLPTQHGYKMPAEWAPHDATWISWPHKLETWPDKFEPVPAVFARMVRALAEGETVNLCVSGPEMEREARKVLKAERADASTVQFHHWPTNDVWIRDYGPIFVQRQAGANRTMVTKWLYNSWGGKYPPFDLDNRIPFRAAELCNMPVAEAGIVLEGGSIDVNGEGLLLTTEACLLNKNRNPHLTREQIEQYLKDFLGVHRVIWLGDGIEGDDTDGHVDDLTRFVGKERIVTIVEDDEKDVNHRALRENLERLHALRTDSGGKFEIIELPMPEPLFFDDRRLPASYANFYIGNAGVLVPTYRSGKKDEAAVSILKDCFPDRPVIGIDSTDLVWGLGSFHCTTQQQPR